MSRSVRTRPVPALLVLLGALLSGCASTGLGEAPGVFAGNVAFGAAVGALGAAVNGQDGLPLRRMGRGATRGAAGGVGMYAGKWLVNQMDAAGTPLLAWPAAALHEVGASVVENAAYDRPPLDRLAFHLAFVRLDWEPGDGAVRARLLPFNALALGLMLGENDLDLRQSLLFGTPVFTGLERVERPVPIPSGEPVAFAFLSTVYLSGEAPGDPLSLELMGHELVHVFQHREWLRANALYVGPLSAPGPPKGLGRWVYLDNPTGLAAAYFVLPAPGNDDRWLEHEAYVLD